MNKHSGTPQGSQNQDEKKDHQHTHEGLSEHGRENQFDDPQAEQAKGHRKHEPTHGAHPHKDGNAQSPAAPTDHTEPGGNRPKGTGTHTARADHK